MKTILKTLIFILITLNIFAQKITLSGYVREQGSMESLSNVSVMIPTLKVGTQTNNYGFFSLTIPSAEEVEISYFLPIIIFKFITNSVPIKEIIR